MPNIPIILLAAGASTRMGSSKALLPWDGATLIESQIKKLLEIGQEVMVVLGAAPEQLIPIISDLNVNYIINVNWSKGMSTSIAFGVDYLIKNHPSSDAVLIASIDQPLINLNHFNQLIMQYKKGAQQIIVSESTKGWRGIPTVFDASYFEELRKLSGDNGAKSVVKLYSEKVSSVFGANLLIDMDTQEIYEQLLKKITHQ